MFMGRKATVDHVHSELTLQDEFHVQSIHGGHEQADRERVCIKLVLFFWEFIKLPLLHPSTCHSPTLQSANLPSFNLPLPHLSTCHFPILQPATSPPFNLPLPHPSICHFLTLQLAIFPSFNLPFFHHSTCHFPIL